MGEALPEDFSGAAVFHAGPVVRQVAPDKWEIIAIGPTTSIRMEPYAGMMGRLGVRAIIGKGGMGQATSESFKRYGGIYLQAAPGCAVILAAGIQRVKRVHWPHLGMAEAMWVLDAGEFGPLVVTMDSGGDSVYRDVRARAMQRLDLLYPEEVPEDA